MAKLHTIVLHKDEDVTSAIHAYLMDKKWKAGVIVSAVGSIYDVTVGNPGSYEMPPKMLQTTINEPCEIVSFMGEITRKCDAPRRSALPGDQYPQRLHRTCAYDLLPRRKRHCDRRRLPQGDRTARSKCVCAGSGRRKRALLMQGEK